MENMQYAEELVREFLVFRGFTNTLQAFEAEFSSDAARGFQLDKIMDLIFSIYVPKFQAEKLVCLFSFFKKCFSSSLEADLMMKLSKLEFSVLRYYIVNALQSGRQDVVFDFFGAYGNDLLQKSADWIPWFVIPYLKNPVLDPRFRVFFSKEWFDTLFFSLRNFLSQMFNADRVPALLKFTNDRCTVKRLKNEIEQLNAKLSQLQASLELKEAQLCQLRSFPCDRSRVDIFADADSKNVALEDIPKISATIVSSCLEENDRRFHVQDYSDSTLSLEQTLSRPEDGLHSMAKLSLDQSSCSLLISERDFPTGISEEEQAVEQIAEVEVTFQETFLGHTSPISRCRFSAAGANVASASVDGTVRIWTHESSASTSRNATIYCGAEILSLEWESKTDRLLFIGTADGGIKAWNVDSKRVVCDLSTAAAFPSVLDLKCSPVEPIFVYAAASKVLDSDNFEKLGFASLTVWNMKAWRAMGVLPLGKDPPAITSLCFNHNGKILAASAVDGMIHMFDMSAGLQITGWPAHDSAVSSVLFGPDETSIFSLGSDGKILEWSLQNQGQVLWSRDCSRFSRGSKHNFRHEMALDSYGRRLLVTSGSVRSPIYQVQGHTSVLRTLPHCAPITTVDWHPTLPIFLTGSADHSVRVTSIT